MGIYPYIQILVRYILYVTSVYLTTLDNCVAFIALKKEWHDGYKWLIGRNVKEVDVTYVIV